MFAGSAAEEDATGWEKGMYAKHGSTIGKIIYLNGGRVKLDSTKSKDIRVWELTRPTAVEIQELELKRQYPSGLLTRSQLVEFFSSGKEFKGVGGGQTFPKVPVPRVLPT